MTRSTDLQFWRDRTQKVVRDILIVHGGKMPIADLLAELAREGYDTCSLAPLLFKFSILVFDEEIVSLRKYRKKFEKPQPPPNQQILVENSEGVSLF